MSSPPSGAVERGGHNLKCFIFFALMSRPESCLDRRIRATFARQRYPVFEIAFEDFFELC